MKSTYEIRWGHKRGAPSKVNPQGNAHNSGKMIERDRKRREAEERNVARGKRSTEEQLAIIAARPGNSARERARLEAML